MHALDILIAVLRGLLALLRSRQEQAVVELALRYTCLSGANFSNLLAGAE